VSGAIRPTQYIPQGERVQVGRSEATALFKCNLLKQCSTYLQIPRLLPLISRIEGNENLN